METFDLVTKLTVITIKRYYAALFDKTVTPGWPLNKDFATPGLEYLR